MTHFTKRYRLVVLFGLVSVLALVLVGRWLNATKRGGQGPAEPFRIAGNLYYVGATDAAAFLITGPEGHIVLDGGYPSTAPMIMASIAKIGFSIKEVKVLLNSEPHPDHAGGLGVLQQASGAELWASEASAVTLASGGDDRDGVAVEGPRVDRGPRLSDNAGRPSLQGRRHNPPRAARTHPAHHRRHTRGCTSWSFPVRDGDRVLNVVSACDLGRSATSQYPEQEADLERSVRVRRGLPVDIWVACHARWWGRYRKFVASRTAKNPTDPFIDPDGYRAYIDAAERDFLSGRMH